MYIQSTHTGGKPWTIFKYNLGIPLDENYEPLPYEEEE